jgi:hypothetical protein
MTWAAGVALRQQARGARAHNDQRGSPRRAPGRKVGRKVLAELRFRVIVIEQPPVLFIECEAEGLVGEVTVQVTAAVNTIWRFENSCI